MAWAEGECLAAQKVLTEGFWLPCPPESMLQRRIARQKWDPPGEKLYAGPGLALTLKETADKILKRAKSRKRDPGKSLEVGSKWGKVKIRVERNEGR